MRYAESARRYTRVGHISQCWENCTYTSPKRNHPPSSYPFRMNATRFLAVMPYGDAWRARRRMFQHHFPPSDSSGIGISRSEEFVRKYLLPYILTSPGEFRKHIRITVGGITLSLAYGLQIRRFDDPWINLAEMTLHTTTEAAVIGRYFVDIFPMLKYVPEWLPGAGFQKVAKDGRRIVNNFFEQLYDAAVQEIVRPGLSFRNDKLV
jgi:hypothetical protein